MTKIDIFSGFLGAGKTTLIRKLIQEVYCGEKVVLIENEFGEIGVDGGFLQDAGIQITEMNSGCICCTLVGDFSKALQEVSRTYSPDRIVIEPSGVGKLSDVIRAVRQADIRDATLNAFCTVVDAKKCKMYLKNFGEFFLDQVENASCIVLSHTSDEAKVQEALTLLRQHTDVTVITTNWDQVSGAEILAAMEQKDTLKAELEKLTKQTKEECCHHHDDEHEHCHHDDEHEHCHHDDGHEHCHHHHADEVFTSWGIETGKTFTKEQIERCMQELETGEYGQILRAKGILNGGESWLYFDYVPGETDVRNGAASVTGRLCVIGCDLKEDKLQTLFLG